MPITWEEMVKKYQKDMQQQAYLYGQSQRYPTMSPPQYVSTTAPNFTADPAFYWEAPNFTANPVFYWEEPKSDLGAWSSPGNPQLTSLSTVDGVLVKLSQQNLITRSQLTHFAGKAVKEASRASAAASASMTNARISGYLKPSLRPIPTQDFVREVLLEAMDAAAAETLHSHAISISSTETPGQKEAMKTYGRRVADYLLAPRPTSRASRARRR